MAPEPKRAKAITTIDRDTVAAVIAFNTPERYPTQSEALEKLIQRAVRLRLHRISDADFEALVDRAISQPASSAA